MSNIVDFYRQKEISPIHSVLGEFWVVFRRFSGQNYYMSDETLDFILEPDDRRKYPRFKSMAFLGLGVNLTPLPPYFGSDIQGILIDLSAGGMAIHLTEVIPEGTKLKIEITFPDHSHMECNVNICRVVKREGGNLIGIQFLDLPDFMKDKIYNMSKDFLNCEGRIQSRADEVCKADCSFFNMCDKPQKVGLVSDMETALQIKFKKAS